jgi:hypothetical protein
MFYFEYRAANLSISSSYLAYLTICLEIKSDHAPRREGGAEKEWREVRGNFDDIDSDFRPLTECIPY